MSDVEWYGVLLPRDDVKPAFVEARDRLADAAKTADWESVFAMVDRGDAGINDWRVGGESWFSPLHQAAWHGASVAVVRGMLDRGAWRTLRAASGDRPLDIARERGKAHLLEALTPTFAHPLRAAEVDAINARLAELVTDAASRSAERIMPIRHLDIAGLTESGGTVWFPIPGMYGGFSIELFKRRLHVESWSRVVGGSGRAYVITADRTTLVDEGFV